MSELVLVTEERLNPGTSRPRTFDVSFEGGEAKPILRLTQFSIPVEEDGEEWYEKTKCSLMVKRAEDFRTLEDLRLLREALALAEEKMTEWDKIVGVPMEHVR